jgi:NAD(P)-dependent dehydrogenase (short-subunit alcohol dehydrogenase family)
VTDSFDVDGAVAVVTGATRGIGHVTAVALARAGARVVVVGRTQTAGSGRSQAGSLDEVVEEITAAGGEARGLQADLTDGAATQRIVDQTLGWYGRCDILVNNAAYTSNGGILDVPWTRWEKGFRVQAVAPLQLVQGFAPSMLERGAGRVVNVSSGAAAAFTPGLALYSVTKAAMERLTAYLDLELGGRGISVNALHIEIGVTTETWKIVRDTQGADLVSLGGEVSETATPEAIASQIEWMVRQPGAWRGNVIDCRSVAALGGPGI